MRKLRILALVLVIMLGVVSFSACKNDQDDKDYLKNTYEVLGASMAPTLKIGDRVKIEKKDNYNEGDIIHFTVQENLLVCHRIIFIIEDNDVIYYICKGDAVQNLDGSVSDGDWEDDSAYIQSLVEEGATLSEIQEDCGNIIQTIVKEQINGKVVKIIKK